MKKLDHELIGLYVICGLLALILIPILIAFASSAFGHKELANLIMGFLSKDIL